MSELMYQDLGVVAAPPSSLATLDLATTLAFANAAHDIMVKAMSANPSKRGALVTMEKGGKNQAVLLFDDDGAATDAFYEKNNSGAFDSGLLFLGTKGSSIFLIGPVPHPKPTFRFGPLVPWIVGGALLVAGVVVYKRKAAKRRAKGGG